MNQKRIIRLKKLREEKLKDSSVIDISKNKIVIQNEVSASIKLAGIISALAAIILAGITWWSVYKSGELIKISNQQLKLTQANLDSAYVQFELNKELVNAAKDQVNINKKSIDLLAAQIEQNARNLDLSVKQLEIASQNLSNQKLEKYLLYEPIVELFDFRVGGELATLYLQNKNPYKIINLRYRFRPYLIYTDTLLNIDSLMISTFLISEIEFADTLYENKLSKYLIVFHPKDDLVLELNPVAKIRTSLGVESIKNNQISTGLVQRYVVLEIKFQREIDNREFTKNFYLRVWGGFDSKDKEGAVIKSSRNEIIEMYRNKSKMRTFQK